MQAAGVRDDYDEGGLPTSNIEALPMRLPRERRVTRHAMSRADG